MKNRYILDVIFVQFIFLISLTNDLNPKGFLIWTDFLKFVSIFFILLLSHKKFSSFFKRIRNAHYCFIYILTIPNNFHEAYCHFLVKHFSFQMKAMASQSSISTGRRHREKERKREKRNAEKVSVTNAEFYLWRISRHWFPWPAATRARRRRFISIEVEKAHTRHNELLKIRTASHEADNRLYGGVSSYFGSHAVLLTAGCPLSSVSSASDLLEIRSRGTWLIESESTDSSKGNFSNSVDEACFGLAPRTRRRSLVTGWRWIVVSETWQTFCINT